MNANVQEPFTVIGSAGFLGSAVVERCRTRGRDVVAVDRYADLCAPVSGVTTLRADLLTDSMADVLSELHPGPVALVAGNSDPRAVRSWQLVLDNAVTTARLLRVLDERRVVLVSSVEVYGTAPGPQREDTAPQLPLDDDALRAWNADAIAVARQPCPPWRVEELCRRLADSDPSGRWVYAMAKRAQELLVADMVSADRLTVFRVANLFGPRQDRVVAKLTRRALAGLPLEVVDTRRTFLAVEDLAEAIAADPPAGVFNAGAGCLGLVEIAQLVLDELGIDRDLRTAAPPAGDAVGVVDTSRFQALTGVGSSHLRGSLRSFVRRLRAEAAPPHGPSIPVVVPPRPEHPELLADRIQQSLWTGSLKGGRWTAALTSELRARLELPDSLTVLPTSSGTDALRLATIAVAGRAQPGDVAVLPSFTFAATGEYLAMLGYRLRFCDVRPDTWTLDPARLDEALAGGDVRVVVAVDALGSPADYDGVMAVCRRHGVPVVADSAPSLGGRSQGRPLGSQADAHAFSMSFAKVVSAAGQGGAVVVPDARPSSASAPTSTGLAPRRSERFTRPRPWTSSKDWTGWSRGVQRSLGCTPSSSMRIRESSRNGPPTATGTRGSTGSPASRAWTGSDSRRGSRRSGLAPSPTTLRCCIACPGRRSPRATGPAGHRRPASRGAGATHVLRAQRRRGRAGVLVCARCPQRDRATTHDEQLLAQIRQVGLSGKSPLDGERAREVILQPAEQSVPSVRRGPHQQAGDAESRPTRPRSTPGAGSRSPAGGGPPRRHRSARPRASC